MSAQLSFKPDERVYCPGSSGEPAALSPLVFNTAGINITTSFVPGVNRLTSEMIGAGTTVTGLFMHPALAAAQREKRYRHLPFSFAAMRKWLADSPAFDTCLVQVSAPDGQGKCSLGVAAEFTPLVMQRAGRIIAAVNRNVPFTRNAPALALRDCACVIEADAPLVTYGAGETDPVSRRIAMLAAGFIQDGATLQTGLGKVPNALFAALSDRRGLRLHSGMVSDGIMSLAESGALDPGYEHVTTVALGSAQLYRWIAGRHDMFLRGVDVTHDPFRLAGLSRFVAVNSAVEVDLFGQCNLELIDGKAVSGSGGASDFARAARLSPGGLSIIALPATFGSKKQSRVTAKLGKSSLVSLSRTEADVIITEEGAADLRGLSVHERAEAIIMVAAAAERAALMAQWQDIAASL